MAAMRPVRILVVDDEPDLSSLIAQYLGRIGYEVEIAATGEEAFEVIGCGLPDFELYLIDMTLPGMKGDEVAARILESNPSAGIVLSSGYGLHPSVADSKSGRIRYLEKPYQPSQLVEVLRSLGTSA
jgi:two-component system response regulator AtoC